MRNRPIDICVYVYYGNNGQPYFCGILNCNDGKSNVIPLYAPGTKITIYDIEHNKKKIKDFIVDRLTDRSRIIISDFKMFIEAFGISFYAEQLNVYDVLLPKLKTPTSLHKAKKNLLQILPAMGKINIAPWQKITANAAVTYAAIEDRGLYVFEDKVYPQWSQRTFSGRTKTSVYNIQGATSGEQIRNPAGRYDDYFINFDWKAADIRMAALLSGDVNLSNACGHLDPYQYVADLLNDGREDGLDRNECKLALLTSINAMETDDHIFDAFPQLKNWILESKQKLHDNKPLFSILGRKYTIQHGRKDLSVFNATMQGSVAHAMQLSIRRVWEEFGLGLIADVHDSIVVTCPRSSVVIKSTIRKIVDIMCHPFSGILDNNPVFPVKVSIGNSWKCWKELKSYS